MITKPLSRPNAVTACGILNLVFAVVGILGLFMTLGMLMIDDGGSNPALKVMRESPLYLQWMKLSIPLGLLASAALLASGIGLLRMSPWARRLTISYGIYAIVLGIFSTVVTATAMIRPLLAEAAHRKGPEAIGAVAGAVGGLFGGCFSLIYPMLLIFFMTRPNVIECFDPPLATLVEPPTNASNSGDVPA